MINKTGLTKFLLISFLVLMLLSSGCDSGQWPLSFFESENSRQEIALPDKTVPEDHNDNELSGRYLFYYPDNEKRFLVPLTRRIPYSETIARSVTENLISCSELNQELSLVGLFPVIPENTVVRGLNISEGVATVNLSASFLTYPENDERLIMNSILSTLKQFDNIEQVMITVEGVEIDDFPGGTPGKIPLGPEVWLNLEIDDDLEDYQDYSYVTIYFSYLASNGEILFVPVTRVIPSQEDDLIDASIIELLKGPRDKSGLFTDIPPKTMMLDFSLNEDILTVDFSSEILNFRGGRTGEENIINQIVLTLTEIPQVGKVKILIDGKEVKLPFGTDLSNKFERPRYLNYAGSQG